MITLWPLRAVRIEHLKGPTKTFNEPNKALEGLIEALKGLAKALKIVHRALKSLDEALKGLDSNNLEPLLLPLHQRIYRCSHLAAHKMSSKMPLRGEHDSTKSFKQASE